MEDDNERWEHGKVGKEQHSKLVNELLPLSDNDGRVARPLGSGRDQEKGGWRAAKAHKPPIQLSMDNPIRKAASVEFI